MGQCGSLPHPELWLAQSYTGLVHSAIALWVPVWNGPIPFPQSSQTSDSYNPLLWWVSRRRDVVQISHWGLKISVFILCTLASGDLGLNHRLLQKEALWWGFCFFFPSHQCKAIVENSMTFVRSTAPKLEPPTPNLNPCSSASKETGIGFTKKAQTISLTSFRKKKNSYVQNKPQVICLK